MINTRTSLRIVGAVSLFLAAAGFASEPVSYTEQIKPVLKARCYACHGALKQKGNLRLDTVAGMLKGGKDGPVLVPKQPDASGLIQRLTATDPEVRMPKDADPLKPEQIKLIEQWIASGAAAPANERAEDDPLAHWAFKPPVQAAIPASKNARATANPVDAFIEASRRSHKLSARPPASKALWLRRVSLDLSGLPPTLEEIHQFEADTSEQAFERVVDRLLASPQYGERWGRHLMDIWRYTDSYGLGAQLRNSQKHIWHWRDWIVESLNTDKSYDRIIREMLAADEIAPTDQNALRATGFLARNYYLFNRTTWLDDVIEHTGKAFLGLTLNCSKCHDHKYDPISNEDYYAMRAVFEPYHVRLDELPGQTDLDKNGLPRAFDLHVDRPTYVHLKGDEKNPDTNRIMQAAVPVALAFHQLQPKLLKLPGAAHNPALNDYVLEDHVQQARQELATAKTQLAKAKEAFAKAGDVAKQNSTKAPATQVAAKEKATTAPDVVLEVHDDFHGPRPELWELEGKWAYVDGVLRQAEVVGERRTLRSKMDHPRDFLARVKFKHTGGGNWKSIGFCFDVHDKQHVLVYLSAHGDSKLQISLVDAKGGSTYPEGGRLAREVKVGNDYELEVRVRDGLLNVLVNGKQSLAYQLPVARHPGKFELITFDATADFKEFELKNLPADLQLVESGQGKTIDPLARAKAELELAQAAEAAATSKIAWLRASWEADRAKGEARPDSETLGKAAAKSSAEHDLARAVADEKRAESDLLTVADAKRSDVEKKLKSAKEARTKAEKRVADPGTEYTSIRGTLKAAEGPDDKDPKGLKPFPTTSTGRRTALADWIADPQNPLTARVLVNHVWTRHFGQPLVASVTDFGRHGSAPTHPELLDWLAVDFMKHGWSLKHLHRLLVLSDTYRMSSSPDIGKGGVDREFSRCAEADPENHFYWRMNAVRMDAQTLRDSMLHLAGLLRLELGGPTIDPEKPDTAMRRSLYFTQSRDDQHKFLEMFDNANIKECYRRDESILPQQALALANSELTSRSAVALAKRIQAGNPDASDEDFARNAFETVLGFVPSNDELDACRQSLSAFRQAQTKGESKATDSKARADLVQALLNHNDFITLR